MSPIRQQAVRQALNLAASLICVPIGIAILERYLTGQSLCPGLADNALPMALVLGSLTPVVLYWNHEAMLSHMLFKVDSTAYCQSFPQILAISSAPAWYALLRLGFALGSGEFPDEEIFSTVRNAMLVWIGIALPIYLWTVAESIGRRNRLRAVQK